MMKGSSILPVTLAVILIIWLLFEAYPFRRVEEKMLVPRASSIDQIPAGELIADREIVQSMDSFNLLDALDKAIADKAEICLQVLLANYGNRSNRGLIQLVLEQEMLSIRRHIDMGDVADNSLHEVCILARDFGGLTKSELLLKIKGVDGQSGSSVTAWLTKDLRRGEAYIDGIPEGTALIFTVFVRRAHIGFSYSQLALFLIYAGIIFLVAVGSVMANKNDTHETHNSNSLL
jgi:hypothetical protein